MDFFLPLRFFLIFNIQTKLGFWKIIMKWEERKWETKVKFAISEW
jgi:hypothetical protein